MTACARKRGKPAKKRHSKRQRRPRTLPSSASTSFTARSQHYYEAGYTDSWPHRRSRHEHKTLLEAAECTVPTAFGWYVFAIEKDDEPRELTEAKDDASSLADAYLSDVLIERRRPFSARAVGIFSERLLACPCLAARIVFWGLFSLL